MPAAKDNPTLPHPCHFRNRPQGGVLRGGSTNSGSTASSWDGLARDWPFWPTYFRFAHTFAHGRLLCIPSACALADSLTCWRSSLTDCSLPPPPHPLHAPAPSTGLENDGMDLHTHIHNQTHMLHHALVLTMDAEGASCSLREGRQAHQASPQGLLLELHGEEGKKAGRSNGV